MVKSIKLSNGIYKKDYKNQICGLKTQNKRLIESPERQSIKRAKSLQYSQSSSSSYPLTQVPGDSKIDNDSFWTSDDKQIVDQTGLLFIHCERCLLSLNFSALGDFLFFVLGSSVSPIPSQIQQEELDLEISMTQEEVPQRFTIRNIIAVGSLITDTSGVDYEIKILNEELINLENTKTGLELDFFENSFLGVCVIFFFFSVDLSCVFLV